MSIERTSSINFASFTRRYFFSNQITHSEAAKKLVQESVSVNSEFDFIGPYLITHLSGAALDIGQSLKDNQNVLIIVKDSLDIAKQFRDLIKNFSAGRKVNVVLVELRGDKMYRGDELVEPDLTELTLEKAEEMKTQVESINTGKKPVGTCPTIMRMSWDDIRVKLMAEDTDLTTIRRLSWPHNHFVTYSPGKEVEASGFWIKANAEAAVRNGGSMTVLPYFSFCDSKSVSMNWMPTLLDMNADDWVDASYSMFLTDLMLNDDNDICASYELLPGKFENGANKLVPVYDLLVDDSPYIVFLSSNNEVTHALTALVTDMKLKRNHQEIVATTIFNGKYDHTLPSNTEVVCPIIVTTHTPRSEDAVDNAVLNSLLAVKQFVQHWGVDTNYKLIIDLKSFVHDPELADLDPSYVNEVAVAYVNGLIRTLKSKDEYKDLKWAVVDLDSEVVTDYSQSQW